MKSLKYYTKQTARIVQQITMEKPGKNNKSDLMKTNATLDINKEAPTLYAHAGCGLSIYLLWGQCYNMERQQKDPTHKWCVVLQPDKSAVGLPGIKGKRNGILIMLDQIRISQAKCVSLDDIQLSGGSSTTLVYHSSGNIAIFPTYNSNVQHSNLRGTSV